MADPLDALTDKEKQTLRLIVRGHDAKTAARELGLSVHTINERLRAARRKLDVTSSREAARLLLESEAEASEAAPENLVYEPLGDAAAPPARDHAPVTAPHPKRALWIGGIAMFSALALALAAAVSGPAPDSQAASEEAATVRFQDAERETAARAWLELVDMGDWQASYDAAGRVFRDPNTVATWKSASEQARIPLGEVVQREAVGFQVVASPEGYAVVRFRTDFANRTGAIESVTLQRENGELRVVGYFIS